MKEKMWVLLCMVIVFVLGAGSMYFIGNKYLERPNNTSKEIIETRKVTITDNTGLSEAVDKVYNTLYNSSDTQFNQILKFHDYIVNKAKYDTPSVNNKMQKRKPYVAGDSLYKELTLKTINDTSTNSYIKYEYEKNPNEKILPGKKRYFDKSNIYTN